MERSNEIIRISVGGAGLTLVGSGLLMKIAPDLSVQNLFWIPIAVGVFLAAVSNVIPIIVELNGSAKKLKSMCPDIGAVHDISLFCMLGLILCVGFIFLVPIIFTDSARSGFAFLIGILLFFCVGVASTILRMFEFIIVRRCIEGSAEFNKE